MRIVILIDNTPDKECKLSEEHGLSMYIEFEGKRILHDTGLSGSFIDNARSLGVDLNNLDFCFLSHGHNDHTGGLRRFIESFSGTKIYLSDKIYSERYFSFRHTPKRNLSTDKALMDIYNNRFVPVKESRWITDNIAAVYCDCHNYPSPQGNCFLSKEINGEETPDDFTHEVTLAIKTDKGLVILSSCSHNGAVNIMKSCERFTDVHSIRYFIGGLHFVDCNKTQDEVTSFCANIHSEYPETTLITGHCTSDKAKNYLNNSDLNIKFFKTGEEIII